MPDKTDKSAECCYSFSKGYGRCKELTVDDVCENGRWHACHVCHGEHKACETACGRPKRKSEAQSSGAAWLGEGSGDGSGEERSDWGSLRTPPPQQSKDQQIVLAAAKVIMAAAGSSAFTTHGQGPTRAGAAAAAAGPKPPKQAPKAPKRFVPEFDGYRKSEPGKLLDVELPSPADREYFTLPAMDSWCPVCGEEVPKNPEQRTSLKNVSKKSVFRKNEGYGVCAKQSCAVFAQRQIDLEQTIGNVYGLDQQLRTMPSTIIREVGRSQLSHQMLLALDDLTEVIGKIRDAATAEWELEPIPHEEVAADMRSRGQEPGSLLAAMTSPEEWL